MKQIFNFLLILLFITTQGCSFFKRREPSAHPPVVGLQTKRILNPQKFSLGGSVAIIPFKAGSNVEAGEELDRISLMFIKGVADVLADEPRFNLLLGDEANEADFLIKGYITTVETRRNMVTFGKSFEVGVKSEVLDRFSGEVLAYFNETKVLDYKDITHQQVSFILGQDLGSFITILKD